MRLQAIHSLPAIQLECDGTALSSADAAALDEITIVQALGFPAQCELVFRDPPGLLSIGGRFPVGTMFRVLLKGQRQPLFAGQVTAVERVYTAHQEQVLRIRGYDRLHSLRKRQTVRAHADVSLRQLAEQLTADLGLSVQTAEDSPTWPYLIQGHETDFDLLTRLGDRCGLYMTLRDDRLHLVSLAGTGAPISLKWRENLHRVTIMANADRAADSITATGWNASRIEAHRRETSSARGHTLAFPGVNAARVEGSGARFVIDASAPDLGHIESLAQAVLDHRSATRLIAEGTAEGDPMLRPGSVIQIDGVDPSQCGPYTLTHCRHQIDRRSGYTTSFSTAPPPQRHESGPRGSIVTFGVIVAIDDPEGHGRVRAALPTFNDVETDWMGVLTPGAGEGKGLISLPDVNDRVLLLLVDGDPASGIVLGGLYGAAGMPDHGIDEGEVRRYTFLTRGGQRICLDDSGGIIRLENRDGSYLELSPERVVLHASTDLTLSAPGQGIRIEGSSVDFAQR